MRPRLLLLAAAAAILAACSAPAPTGPDADSPRFNETQTDTVKKGGLGSGTGG